MDDDDDDDDRVDQSAEGRMADDDLVRGDLSFAGARGGLSSAAIVAPTEEEAPTCAICQETIEGDDLEAWGDTHCCGNSFHVACLARHARQRQEAKCPLCQRTLKGRTERRLLKKPALRELDTAMEGRFALTPKTPGAELIAPAGARGTDKNRLSVYFPAERPHPRWYTGVAEEFDATWRVHRITFRMAGKKKGERDSAWYNLQMGEPADMRERQDFQHAALAAVEQMREAGVDPSSDAFLAASEASKPAMAWVIGSICKMNGECMKSEGHSGLCEARTDETIFRGFPSAGSPRGECPFPPASWGGAASSAAGGLAAAAEAAPILDGAMRSTSRASASGAVRSVRCGHIPLILEGLEIERRAS